MKPSISFVSPADESFGPARELLCSIWPLLQGGEHLAVGEPLFLNRTVLVGPLRQNAQPMSLELPEAGAYLIDLGYPNGTSFRTTALVGDGEQYRLVVQNPMQTPRSVVSSAPLPGLVPRVLTAALKSMRLQGPDLEVEAIAQPPDISLKRLREFAADLGSFPDSTELLWSAKNADLSHSMRLPNSVVADFQHGYQRRWLVVTGGEKHPTMVAYPVGWNDEDGDAFNLSMSRKAKEGREANKWSVSLKLMNPVFGTLIEHLTRRDVHSGMEIFSQSVRGQAMTMLYEKQANPFSAAAGAYLIALSREDQEHPQHWMANLTEWFDWLPDGPIALGWSLLRKGRRGSRTWNDARELFFTACSRGLPYYTVGLHVLVDALTLLSMADTDDTEVRDMLAVARAVDVACVRSEPFTTLQVSRFLGLPVQ